MSYQKMYSALFNAITDAIRELEHQNVNAAKALLVLAQQKTEAMYMMGEETEARPPQPQKK